MKMHCSFLLSCLALFGCSREASPPQSDPARVEPDRPAGGEHGSRARIDIGEAKIGGLVVRAFQGGKVAPGKEAEFDLELAGGTNPPVAVRGWIGAESGKGSMKARFDKDGGQHMHGHVDVPDPLPADARLWVEVETKAGAAKGSFQLSR